jgi:hypothetical protein
MGAGGRKPREPNDANSVGFKLFQIIGGEDANFKITSESLGISPGSLSNYIHAHAPLSSRVVERKNWAAILERDFPQGWAAHGQAFLDQLGAAPATTRDPDAKRTTKHSRAPREPSDKDSLGYKLYLIIGGANASVSDAAPKLGISPNPLSMYLHGHNAITRRQFDGKGWQAAFETHFAAGWKAHGEAFMAQLAIESPAKEAKPEKIAKAPKEPAAKTEKPAAVGRGKGGGKGKAPKEPENKDSLGYKLYEIIGGADAKIGVTATMLGIEASRLSGMLHSKMPLRKAMFDNKNWKNILAANFPQAWAEKGAAFVAQLTAESASAATHAPKGPRATYSFNANRRGKPSKRPENEETLGFTIWSLMGERNFRLVDAVPVLRLDEIKLGNLIHNRGKVPQSFMDQHDWAGKLERANPEGWAIHGEAFLRHKATMPLFSREEERAQKAANTPDPAQAWRKVVGTVILQVVEGRGDDIDVLRDETNIPALKNTWGRVIAGDPTLPESIFRDAIKTAINLYQLERARDPEEQKAYKTLRSNTPESRVY